MRFEILYEDLIECAVSADKFVRLSVDSCGDMHSYYMNRYQCQQLIEQLMLVCERLVE